MNYGTDIVNSLRSPQQWFERRDRCMDSARRNMAALTRDLYSFPSEFRGRSGDMIQIPPRLLQPKLERTDPVVLGANASWVQRARRAHRIGMGFEPVIVVEENDQLVPVYVIKPVKTAATWATKSIDEIQSDIRRAVDSLKNREYQPKCKHGFPTYIQCQFCQQEKQVHNINR